MTEPAKRDLKAGIALDELPDGAMLLGQVGGEDAVLVNSGGQLLAMGASCSHYHGNLAEGCDFPDEVRPVYALITAHNLFRLLEGPHSARAHEAIQHLLLPKLRAALLHWYRCFGDDANLEASEFRKHLSRLSGEKL